MEMAKCVRIEIFLSNLRSFVVHDCLQAAVKNELLALKAVVDKTVSIKGLFSIQSVAFNRIA